MRTHEELSDMIVRIQQALDDFVRLSETLIGSADEQFTSEAARLRDDIGARLMELLQDRSGH